MYNLPSKKTVIRSVVLNPSQHIVINAYCSHIHILSFNPLSIEITDLNINESFAYQFSNSYQLGRGYYNLKIKNTDTNPIQIIYGEYV